LLQAADGAVREKCAVHAHLNEGPGRNLPYLLNCTSWTKFGAHVQPMGVRCGHLADP
jgi:hypothetical protein